MSAVFRRMMSCVEVTCMLVQSCSCFGIWCLLFLVYQRLRLFTPPLCTSGESSKYVIFSLSVAAYTSTRCTAIGTHHLEYGFPSTHSTNSVSMALFIFGQVHSAYSGISAISSTTYWISCGILGLYAVSIVFGRIYTGMHSFTDCGVGVALGASIWAAYAITGNAIERWLESGSWIGKALYSCIAFLFDKRCSSSCV